MMILESVFNGVILSCKCGLTAHVGYKDLHQYMCDCGASLHPGGAQSVSVKAIQSKTGSPARIGYAHKAAEGAA